MTPIKTGISGAAPTLMSITPEIRLSIFRHIFYGNVITVRIRMVTSYYDDDKTDIVPNSRKLGFTSTSETPLNLARQQAVLWRRLGYVLGKV